jgi:lipopolysaccharide/colanic/teichoic acid biosynthesis glycosyltransferase
MNECKIRLMDIFFAVMALVMFSPLLMLLIPALRVTGEGEIFYKQERIGRNFKPFMIFKFATMVKNSPHIGAGSITELNDPRVLPLGKILRKSKINELPQLLNIISGDMSLIGPRPHVKRDLKGVSRVLLEKSLSQRPGLSGIASIIFRNEEEIIHSQENPREFYDSIIAPYKAALDVWYAENKSFKLYCELIFFTILKVLKPDSLSVYSYYKSLPPIPEKLKVSIW